MKNLNQYIYESLLLEAYDAENVIKKLQQIEGFDTKIKASNNPTNLYFLKFNKTTGEFEDSYKTKNDEYLGDYYIVHGLWEKYGWYWGISKEFSDKSVDIVANTKKSGIIIGYFDDANTEIIKQFVKDNLKLFDTSSEGLTKDEIAELDKFFSSMVKNYEKKLDKKTFAAYFPSREDAKKLGRVGLSNIPHITISRPNNYKGNLKVTSYRNGNWQGTEWPDQRRMMNNDGTLKYPNIDSILDYLEKTLKKYGDSFGAELKD